jgi:hypothetical protein
MTPDPLTAALDQLAAHHEQLAELDAREARHFGALGEQLTQLAAIAATLGHALRDDTAALARIEALEHKVNGLAASLTGDSQDGAGRHQPEQAPAWWQLTGTDRQDAAAGLRAWVGNVYRPGYGHLAAPLGPCWEAHDLCLYGLDILAPGPDPARHRRPAGRRDRRLRPRPAPQALPPEPAMTSDTLDQALAYAAQGWPVFPCQPGRKVPATTHGHHDATTDPAQITRWFTRHPGWNLAVATGASGPDVLDVDQHGPAGNGYAALARLKAAGMLDGATGYVRTPSGGLHAYFTGTTQHNGHLPAHHIDFRSAGGYVLIPPSKIAGKPYERISTHDGHGHLDWQQVIALLNPARQHQRSPHTQAPGQGTSHLAAWVAAQPEGNRNAGLFWAACRTLDANPAADLSPLAAAARQAGLGELEITRTLNSARRTGHARPSAPSPQAEGEAK